MNQIHQSIVTVNGNSYILYLKAEYKHNNVSSFSVLAFEQVSKDSHGQKFLHELLDQAPRKVPHD